MRCNFLFRPKLTTDVVADIDLTTISELINDLKYNIMALMSGGLSVTFPPTINANVTNTSLPVTVSGVVATSEVTRVTLGTEKVYAVTNASQSIPASDIPTSGVKGAEIQYLSENSADRLYTRYDGQPATAADSKTTGLQVISLESLSDVNNFRWLGSGGTIKVIFRG